MPTIRPLEQTSWAHLSAVSRAISGRLAAIQPSAPAHVGLARALYDANRGAEALSELKVAVRVNPKYAPAYLLLGEIHQGEGRNAEARAAYQTFLNLSPSGDQARAVREILSTQLK